MLEFLLSTAVIVGQMDVTHNYVQTDFLTTTGEIITVTQFDDSMPMSKEMGGC
jgi:hypothetical protein